MVEGSVGARGRGDSIGCVGVKRTERKKLPTPPPVGRNLLGLHQGNVQGKDLLDGGGALDPFSTLTAHRTEPHARGRTEKKLGLADESGAGFVLRQ